MGFDGFRPARNGTLAAQLWELAESLAFEHTTLWFWFVLAATFMCLAASVADLVLNRRRRPSAFGKPVGTVDPPPSARQSHGQATHSLLLLLFLLATGGIR